MPLLKYFTVMGLVLLGLLVIADAFMSRPQRPVFASKFDADTPAWLVTTDSLARPITPPHIAEVPVEVPAAAAAKVEARANAEPDKTETKKKKVRAARRHPKPEAADNGSDSNGAWRGDDSWSRNSWSNNSWGDNSWDKNSSPNSRTSRKRQVQDAFAYVPRQQQDFWSR